MASSDRDNSISVTRRETCEEVEVVKWAARPAQQCVEETETERKARTCLRARDWVVLLIELILYESK